MTVPVTEPLPMDPRLAGFPEVNARKLAMLPPAWLDQLLGGKK